MLVNLFKPGQTEEYFYWMKEQNEQVRSYFNLLDDAKRKMIVVPHLREHAVTCR